MFFIPVLKIDFLTELFHQIVSKFSVLKTDTENSINFRVLQ